MRPRRLVRLWSGALLLATVAGLLSSAVLWTGMRLAGQELTAAGALTGMADWYLWALLAPAVVWLALRFPVEPGRWRSSLALHLALGTAVALLELAAYTVVNIQYNRLVLGRDMPAWSGPYFAGVVAQWLPLALLVYGVIVAAVNGVAYQRRLRREEVRAAELGSRLAEAELAWLRSRLHPHFLFNTLNTVATLVREGRGEESVEVLETLSRLLRRALERSERASVPLAEELDFLEDYLAVEGRRMEDRLRIHWSIEPGVDTSPVPPLILQPVVENAVRHGLAPRPRGGVVRVAARRRGDGVELVVEDDGTGVVPPVREGVGLSTTRARLAALDGAGSLTVEPREGGGTRVRMTVPPPPPTPGPAAAAAHP